MFTVYKFIPYAGDKFQRVFNTLKKAEEYIKLRAQDKIHIYDENGNKQC